MFILGESVKGKNNLKPVPNYSKLGWILCSTLTVAHLIQIPHTTFLVFQYVLKTSWRCLQRVNFYISKTSSRRVCTRSSSRSIQGVLKKTPCKASSRRLENVFNTSLPRPMFAETITFSIIDTQWRFFLKVRIDWSYT